MRKIYAPICSSYERAKIVLSPSSNSEHNLTSPSNETKLTIFSTAEEKLAEDMSNFGVVKNASSKPRTGMFWISMIVSIPFRSYGSKTKDRDEIYFVEFFKVK